VVTKRKKSAPSEAPGDQATKRLSPKSLVAKQLHFG
jgi:hypothetical protein